MASKNVVDSKEQLLFKATSINNEKIVFGGYNQELLVSSLNKTEKEFYVCTKCNGLMRNACHFGEDETQVCETCVGKENAQPMAKPRRKISQLKTKCPLRKRGCHWKGNLSEIEAHMLECPEILVECKANCGVTLKLSEQFIHSTKECQLRNINCKHCKSVILFKERENHNRLCLEFPSACPKKCQNSVLRKNIDSHLEKDCPNATVGCANNCGLMLKRTNSITHNRKECANRDINCKYCEEVCVFSLIRTHHETCLEIPVTCPNNCMKNLLRKELDSHLGSVCPNTSIECENGCGENRKRSEMANHYRRECGQREVNCTHCKTSLLFKDVESHNTACEEFLLACPNECMGVIKRQDMESHIENDCPNTLLECPYTKMGCLDVIKRCQLAEHKKSFQTTHFKTGIFYALNKVELLDARFLELEKENTHLKDINEKVTKQMNVLLQKMDIEMAKIVKEYENLRLENKQLSYRVQTLEDDQKSDREEIKRMGNEKKGSLDKVY